MPPPLLPLQSLSQLAQSTGRKLDQLLYVVRSRRIEPTLHMGNLRLFNAQAAQVILGAAAAIDATREQGVPDRGVEVMVSDDSVRPFFPQPAATPVRGGDR